MAAGVLVDGENSDQDSGPHRAPKSGASGDDNNASLCSIQVHRYSVCAICQRHREGG